ncbi:MAG: LPS-assembly protein LptD [Candidatus Rokubacteria bacterium]|nr:LPS-assembly protein LptD [Candidatus Rokubacteria bacterium]
MTRARSSALLVAVLSLVAPCAARAQTAATVPTPGGDVTVLADRLEEIGPDNLLIATGNVEVTRGTARLTADRVELNRETGDVVALGRAIFYDGEDQLRGERIDYNFKTGTGVVHQGEARAAPYYRISGERMERLGESLYRVRRGVFTTCEADPPAWSFRAGSATADLDELVYGTNASFWVRSVPLIPWMPFFAAAIRRERQTGFLFPTFGDSTRKGFFVDVPFFWAISDSQDATLTLKFFEKLGVGASAEYRYLLSTTQHGTVTGFFLRETEAENDDRGWFGFLHDWTIGRGTSLKAKINMVTDDDVLRQFSDTLHERHLQKVESNVFLRRGWETWNLVGNLFWYQDLTQERPVELQRLPEIRLEGTRQPLPGLPGFLYQVESSAVEFVREVGSNGTRLDVHPRVSRPIRPAGLFTVTPFVGGRLTAYDKTVTGSRVTGDGITVEVTEDEARLRRLLEVGTDIEARASRVFLLGGFGGLDALLHSIEPRVNYTSITGQATDHLPLWTDEIDVLQDKSLITYSLTNRFRARTVAPPGTEPVRFDFARIGLSHTYNFRSEDRPLGDVVGTLILQPTPRFAFRGDASYNVYGEGLQTVNTDVALTVPYLIASVGTRFDKPQDVDFLQGTLAAELSRYVVARNTIHWDLQTDTVVENRLAIDLRFQCWAFSVEWVTRAKDEDEIRFTVNLLGVGSPITTTTGVGAKPGAEGTK